MELDTRELFRCLARDCNYRDEKIVRCFKSGLHCTRYTYIAFKAQKLLEDSEVLHVYSNRNFYVRNHVSQKAKGEILSNWDAIANRETAIQVQVMFSAKQHPDCRHRWPEINCDKADGHSQTGNRKKKMSASWIRKTSHKNKGNEKRLETLFTHCRSNIKFLIFTQTSFYCGFDRYKVMDWFRVQLVNWRLLLFQWCKMPFEHFY